MWGNAFIPCAALLICLHIIYFSKVKNELLLIAVITVVGVIIDSTLQWYSIFIFKEHEYIPLWLVVLWISFAATICHSLQFLKSSITLQFLVGALIAPLSYVAGYQLEAVEFGLPKVITYAYLGLIWSVLMVFIFYLKSYLIKEERDNA